jgi:hypothetical protein
MGQEDHYLTPPDELPDDFQGFYEGGKVVKSHEQDRKEVLYLIQQQMEVEKFDAKIVYNDDKRYLKGVLEGIRVSEVIARQICENKERHEP